MTGRFNVPLISKRVAIAASAIVIAFLVLVPIIPDGRDSFCPPKERCIQGASPFVSVAYFAFGIGMVDSGGIIFFVYTPWMCSTTHYVNGSIEAYGCNRGIVQLNHPERNSRSSHP